MWKYIPTDEMFVKKQNNVLYQHQKQNKKENKHYQKYLVNKK